MDSFPMLWILLVVITFWKPATCIDCNKTTSNVGNSLKQHLFCNGYDPTVRPAKSEFDVINITAVAFLYRFGVNEYRKTLSMEITYRLQWYDASLNWNASDWSNITMLRANYDEIWFPQFEHINFDYDGVSSLYCTNPQCLLYQTGKLVCSPSCILTAKCSTDYARWPYNTMDCHSWFSNYDKELVDKINFLPFKTYVALVLHPTSANWCLTSFKSNETMLNIPGATRRTAKELRFSLQYVPHVVLVTFYHPAFALVMLNLFICCLHSHTSEKATIVLISLMCHFRLVHNILFLSTDIPASVWVAIVSAILTLLLFLITLILRWLHDLHTTPPRVIVRKMKWLSNNRMMGWFAQTDYLSLGNQPTAFSNYVELRDWPKIVHLTDRCVFVLYTFIYLMLFWRYVPMQHDVSHLENELTICDR